MSTRSSIAYTSKGAVVLHAFVDVFDEDDAGIQLEFLGARCAGLDVADTGRCAVRVQVPEDVLLAWAQRLVAELSARAKET